RESTSGGAVSMKGMPERSKNMVTTRVEIDVPERMTQYVVLNDEKEVRIRNAMVLYPYIQNGQISHGKAAELLGMHKLDLIKLYSNLGLPYLDMTEEEFQDELATVRGLSAEFL
ncbi:MAG: UPF0175 family protein, partial [Lachnospiraceae bacterium]|nr:UPF0175 family protein [Lachnospiraceae bacterium]